MDEQTALLKAFEIVNSEMLSSETLLMSVATLLVAGLGYFFSSEDKFWGKKFDLDAQFPRLIFAGAFTATLSFAYSMIYVMMTAHDRLMLRIENKLPFTQVKPYFDYYTEIDLPRIPLYFSTAVSVPLIGLISLVALAYRIGTYQETGKRGYRISLTLFYCVFALIVLVGLAICFWYINKLWGDVVTSPPKQP